MISEPSLVDFLTDLQQIEKMFPRADVNLPAQGEMILDAFLRHTASSEGAVYLREPREASLRLAAHRSFQRLPDTFAGTIPEDVAHAAIDAAGIAIFPAELDPRPRILIPLRSGREPVGMILLSGGEEAGGIELRHLDLLRAGASYIAAVLRSQRMASEVREGDFLLKYRLWELESLYDIGLSITSTLDLDKLAEEILIRTISLLNARRAALYLRSGDGRFVLHRSFGDVRAQFLEEELNEDVTRALLVDGKPVRFEARADCIFPACESFVALPITTGEEVIGVLAAADRELREGGLGPFDDNDVRVLSLFANQVAIALENARLHKEALEKQAMEREIEVAATIQRDILPRALPQVPGFEIDALSRPARQLGGDYHAFFERDGALSLCVADVSGKSVPAAILVSAFHAALQLLFHEGRDLGDIATELNRHIHLWSAENKFITLVLATIDPKSETIRYVNAGHNPAYVIRGCCVDPLVSHGLPVGLLPEVKYRTQSAGFPRGSLLAVYSDGITEAANAAEEEFGNGRLEEILAARATEPCAAIRSAIAEAVDAFSAGEPQTDDQTLVLVRM